MIPGITRAERERHRRYRSERYTTRVIAMIGALFMLFFVGGFFG